MCWLKIRRDILAMEVPLKGVRDPKSRVLVARGGAPTIPGYE